jgi:hypothetical protein
MNTNESFGARLGKLMAMRMVVGAAVGVFTFVCGTAFVCLLSVAGLW